MSCSVLVEATSSSSIEDDLYTFKEEPCSPESESLAGIIIQTFPNPSPDARFNRYEIERFRTWVMKIGGDIVGEDTMFIHKNRRVCHRHFEEIYTLPNKRLTGLAIPTLHIPGVHVGPHPRASSGMSLNTGLRADVPEKVGEQGDLPKQIAPSAVASTSITFDEKEDTIKKAVTLRPVKPMMSKIERELRDVLAEIKVALRKCCNSKNKLKTKFSNLAKTKPKISAFL